MSFYTKKIWFLGILQFFLWAAIGCSFNNYSSIQEEIYVILPQWPPKDCLTNEYPKLSRWEISVCSSTAQEIYHIQENHFSIMVNKNEPVSILAVPVTYAQVNDECYETDFFYPAGGIYPFSKSDDNSLTLNWENGFCAKCLQSILLSKSETSISDELLISFSKKFNWKKLIEEIENEIQLSISKEDSAFFNPWLIDSNKLLTNLSEKNFSKTLISLSDCTEIFLNDSDLIFYEQKDDEKDCQRKLFSRFIPENEYLYQKKKTFIRKEGSLLLSAGNEFGILFSCSNRKKVSKEIVLLPIYCKRL